jgi:hypothetical protein
VRYDGAAKAAICGNYTAGKAASADYVCNPDFNVSQLGVLTRWTPVRALTFSVEVQWFHLDQKFAGSAVLSPSAPKPATRYEFADQDTFQPQVRAQRRLGCVELSQNRFVCIPSVLCLKLSVGILRCQLLDVAGAAQGARASRRWSVRTSCSCDCGKSQAKSRCR